MKKLSYLLICILFFNCSENISELESVVKKKNSKMEEGLSQNSVLAMKTGVINYDWAFQYFDNFDNANSSNDYGLNDNLGNRQLHGPWKNTTWTRKEGTWYTKTIQPWFSQVNHPNTPNALSFHLEHSAVMLNNPISAGSAGKYRVSFTTNPVKGDQSNGSWTSFMLDSDNFNYGYVTGTDFGFLISSNGGVSVFQNGNTKSIIGTVAAASEYKVVLDISVNQLVATINGAELLATLDEPLPSSAYAFLGAYIEPQSGFVSWFDDLLINTQHGINLGHVEHYGYYWASGYYGDHLNEVSNYSNFNFIETITANLPNTKTHVLQAKWEFWSDSSGQLRSDWLTQWNLLLADINQNINKIKALYVCDEPFWAVNVNLSDYNMVLNQIKTDLPNLPIIAVFAYPTVEDTNDTRIAGINNSIDWVGADKYVAVNNFNEVENMNNLLIQARPNNDVFLIPQTFFAGTTTDAEVAEINWKYYNDAINRNEVIGLWNFGLWSHQQPEELPMTLQVQRLIGEIIISN